MAAKYRKPLPNIRPEITRLFWSHVRQGSSNECWPWQACQDKDGYGVFGIWGFGNYRASRVAYFLHNGIDPGDQCVLHRCDNPPCANPHHFFLGTIVENNADKQAKGRQARGLRQGQHTHPEAWPKGNEHYARKKPELLARGERHGMASLTESQVREIYHRCVKEGVRQNAVAREYGTSTTAVNLIVKRKTWRHLVL